MLRVTRLTTLIVTALATGSSMASDPATQPTTAPSALVGNVLDAKGLDEALERLHAPMRETSALSPADELK